MPFNLQVQGFVCLSTEILLRPADPKNPRSTAKWVALGDWLESLLSKHKGRFAKKPLGDEVCFDLVFDALSGLQGFKREYNARMTPQYWEGSAYVPQPQQPGPKPAELRSLVGNVLEEKRRECIAEMESYGASGHTALARKSEIRAEALARQIDSFRVAMAAREERGGAQ